MDLTGRPLLDTEPDHLLFAGREEELGRVVRLARSGVNTVVVGERGSGKTTLLRQAAFVLRRDGGAPVFVEGRLADTPRRFLDLVRARLGLPPLPERADDPIELAALVGSLREGIGEDLLVVLVDEIAPEVAATVFGRLRDEVWQIPITWVVAGTPDDVVALRTPPADAFFEAAVVLDDLDRDGQRRLLEARLGEEGAAIAARVDEGNPRRLLALARAVKEGATVDGRQEWERAREERLAELGRPARMLMAELESLGAASASDERLLRRLGWTRPRAVQVLRELEDAGLVTASYARGPGGGRQKVYRPVEGGA